MVALTSNLILGSNGTIYFTNDSGSGNARAWVDSSGLHSNNGLNASTFIVPVSIRSDGTIASYMEARIVDGIVKA